MLNVRVFDLSLETQAIFSRRPIITISSNFLNTCLIWKLVIINLLHDMQICESERDVSFYHKKQNRNFPKVKKSSRKSLQLMVIIPLYLARIVEKLLTL